MHDNSVFAKTIDESERGSTVQMRGCRIGNPRADRAADHASNQLMGDERWGQDAGGMNHVLLLRAE
ncbi:hypothetical protein GCM10029992_08050 [Glycomyces albus]